MYTAKVCASVLFPIVADYCDVYILFLEAEKKNIFGSLSIVRASEFCRSSESWPFAIRSI